MTHRAQLDPRPATDPLAAPGRCVSVIVAGGLYGLLLDDVQEVIGLRPLTRVFHGPAALAGVMGLRGDVLPVIELGLLLQIRAEMPPQADTSRIVVVRDPKQPRLRAGLYVDELGPLRQIGLEGLSEPPATLAESARELVAGVIAQSPPCCVLNVKAVLGSPALQPRFLAHAEGDR
jgi:purine-binding chemotaxis protein CheW